jgi:hypothetical protein
MRVLEAFGQATARGLETRVWPLDEERILRREYLELFLDVAATRAGRQGGAAVGWVLGASDPSIGIPRATGLAVVRLEGRLAFLWSGPAGGCALPDVMKRRALASVELRGALDDATAHERLRALYR